ncbi:MAG: polysaccharide biosynthesis protein PslG [Solirubrobacteraceae bacterium]|nr:polysaccharide biosynthesis protein PslG [Solirubrobacteraceae bacterium]
MSRPLRLLIVLAIAAGLLGAAIVLFGSGGSQAPPFGRPAARPAAGPAFLGLAAPELIALPRAQLDQTLDAQLRLRVGLIRQTFDWAQIERSPGRYDFRRYDALMQGLAARGLAMLPVLFDPPAFRSSRPAHGARDGTYPPRRFADLGAFAAVAVRRYGPAGSFWRSHPRLPRVPIRAWQVWNEPSLPVYWPSGPDPAAYARLLGITARAIRGADPHATVVSAGIPQSRIGVPFGRYVQGLYRAGARGSFDVLAIHAYARNAAGVLAAVAQARRLMDGHGDHRPIWVTELGWASGGPPSAFTAGLAGQAQRTYSALVELAQRRSRLRLRGVVYSTWIDGGVYPGGTDFWGLHTGLLSIAGRPKPAYYAFQRAADRVAELLERPAGHRQAK